MAPFLNVLNGICQRDGCQGANGVLHEKMIRLPQLLLHFQPDYRAPAHYFFAMTGSGGRRDREANTFITKIAMFNPPDR